MRDHNFTAGDDQGKEGDHRDPVRHTDERGMAAGDCNWRRQSG